MVHRESEMETGRDITPTLFSLFLSQNPDAVFRPIITHSPQSRAWQEANIKTSATTSPVWGEQASSQAPQLRPTSDRRHLPPQRTAILAPGTRPRRDPRRPLPPPRDSSCPALQRFNRSVTVAVAVVATRLDSPPRRSCCSSPSHFCSTFCLHYTPSHRPGSLRLHLRFLQVRLPAPHLGHPLNSLRRRIFAVVSQTALPRVRGRSPIGPKTPKCAPSHQPSTREGCGIDIHPALSFLQCRPCVHMLTVSAVPTFPLSRSSTPTAVDLLETPRGDKSSASPLLNGRDDHPPSTHNHGRHYQPSQQHAGARRDLCQEEDARPRTASRP
jgi:hypothetical protein